MAKWKPSKKAAQEYGETMREIDEFCTTNNISKSRSNDSYYFTHNGVNYRVSNHTIESSNARAVDMETGETIREAYHGGREANTVYIHAGKTRIIDIYKDIVFGYDLDSRGNRK